MKQNYHLYRDPIRFQNNFPTRSALLLKILLERVNESQGPGESQSPAESQGQDESQGLAESQKLH